MKKILFTLIVALLSLSGYAQNRTIIDKIVASVGNEFVLLSEIEEQHALIKDKQGGDMPENARCLIMDNLMVEKLLLNQAKVDSIEIADEEIEAQLTARIDQILGLMNNDIGQFEAYYGQSISDVKDGFRDDLKSKLLIQRMQGQIMADVKVTPSEVIDFFGRIPKDSLPYFNSEVELKEIVYKPRVNDEQKKLAIEKLQDLRKRIIEDGEDFAALAKKYSSDPGSARLGGDLGWQKRGNFVPEFEAAAFSLDKNEMSPVIESEFGFHLIQLLERRGNSFHARHILITPDITSDDLILASRKLDSIRHFLQTDSLKFTNAVKLFSEESEQSYNMGGNMVNPKTGDTFFEIGDLAPEIYFTIDTMEVMDISKPIEYRNRRGEVMYRIVWLLSRSQPHQANLKQDYSKIQTAALEQKKGAYINQWVSDKINSTFINFDPQLMQCDNMGKWIVTTPKP